LKAWLNISKLNGDNGKTDWYREDGTLDSTSDTPSDNDDD